MKPAREAAKDAIDLPHWRREAESVRHPGWLLGSDRDMITDVAAAIEARDDAHLAREAAERNAMVVALRDVVSRLAAAVGVDLDVLVPRRGGDVEKPTPEPATKEALRQMDAINERLRGLLGRWLQWEGRITDDTTPLETETAKVLGHSDDCELVEYGVCTCALAAPPAPVAAPKCERYEEDHGDYSVRFHCKNCGEHVGRHLNASQFITPAAAPVRPAVPTPRRTSTVCGADVGGAACNRSPHGDALHVYDGGGTESADRLGAAHAARYASPPAVPEKCGVCSGRGGLDSAWETWDEEPILTKCPRCGGTGRAPARP